MAGDPRAAVHDVNWLGPTLMKYGTEEQKAASRRDRARRGDLVPGLLESGAGPISPRSRPMPSGAATAM